MDIKSETEKKAWVAPVIEALDIDQTLGGVVERGTENIVYVFPGGSGRGTIPSP